MISLDRRGPSLDPTARFSRTVSASTVRSCSSVERNWVLPSAQSVREPPNDGGLDRQDRCGDEAVALRDRKLSDGHAQCRKDCQSRERTNIAEVLTVCALRGLCAYLVRLTNVCALCLVCACMASNDARTSHGNDGFSAITRLAARKKGVSCDDDMNPVCATQYAGNASQADTATSTTNR